MKVNGIIFVCMFLCIIKSIRCALSSTDARSLNRKIEMVRSGMEHKLLSALTDIDDLRDNMGTCKCPDWNATITDIIAEQSIQSTSNRIEDSDDTMQSDKQRVMKALEDEKVSRKKFENKIVDLVEDQTKYSVHGGWSDWSSWGSCSVTCGVGMQRKDRSCSKPIPDRFGNHCLGDSRDDRICIPVACADGQWGAWAIWGSCSVTCGGGLRTRDRLCNNPAPSLLGNTCPGPSEKTEICNIKACHDGGWSSWHGWGSCSVSCGGGIKSRTRSCTNPAPSTLGRDCMGNNKDMTSCSNVRCPETVSAFSVTRPHSHLTNNNYRLTFTTTIYNQGGDFNAATGVFTCSKPGVYQFSVFLVKKRSDTRVDRVQCYLYKDSSHVILIKVDPTDDDTDKGQAQAANSVVIHLSRGQTVSLQECADPSSTMEHWSSFSGVLINPDV